MPITYAITIDLNDDGDSSDLGETITADILKVRWRLGMREQYDRISDEAFAEVIVRNRSGTYSPEQGKGLVGQFLRIQSDDGLTIRTHFVGVITLVEPEAGEYGSQQSRILATGREAEVRRNTVQIPPMLNARSDEVLNAIYDRIKMRYEGVNQYCIIGREGYNLIDSAMIFPADAAPRSFEIGKSTFAYIGDLWEEGLVADEAIRQIVEGEGGYFFFDRSGQATFYNRHHVMLNTTTQATFSDDMEGLTYSYGARRVTEIRVRLTPRTIGASNSLIWSLLQPTRIRQGQSRTITARYTLDNRPVGLLSSLRIDYTARSGEEASSEDVSNTVIVVVQQANFSAATIEIRNHANTDVYLHQLDLYGTPLHTGDRMDVTETDHIAAALYGIQGQIMDQPALTNIDEASAIAQDELQRRSVPQGIISTLQSSTRSHPEDVLTLTLFDRIRISEAQTGQDRTYRIIAEEHLVDQGGNRHRVIWSLQPDESETFFIVDLHSIDGDRVLAAR